MLIISLLTQEVFWSVGYKMAEKRMKTKPLKNAGESNTRNISTCDYHSTGSLLILDGYYPCYRQT